MGSERSKWAVVLVLGMLLVFYQFMRPRFKPEEGKVYLFTHPAGATISVPQAQSVHGFQVKPIATSPGPLPIALEERKTFIFVLDLPGYETKEIHLQKADLSGEGEVQQLEPKVAGLVPLLYWIRDYVFALFGALLWLSFYLFHLRPLRQMKAYQDSLWASGELQTGLRIHEYELLEELGKGASGAVFSAQKWDAPERKYALKILHNSKDEFALEELEREAKVSQTLSHPSIVHLYDWGEERGLVYLVFDLVEGQSIDRVEKRGLKQVLAWLEQLSSALDYAHSKGVVHRDIKPANILVDEKGRAYILDFGISSPEGEESESFSGTVGFVAPEQLRGEVTPACDYYSLGVTFHKVLSGEMPFEGKETFQILASQGAGEFVSLSQKRPELPSRLTELVDSMMSLNPEDRICGAQKIRDQLTLINDSLSKTAD